MPSELRPVGLGNLRDVIDILNVSSQGYSFQFDLDLAKFLLLGRFWGLSYPHSKVGYRDGQAEGVVLNCVDAGEGEAFQFYWGVLPQYRSSGVGRDLMHSYLDQVRAEGYRRTYGVCSLDSPIGVFRKLGYEPGPETVELAAEQAPAAPGHGFEIRALGVEEYLAERPAAGERPWEARANFLRGAAPLVEFAGAYSAGAPAAWCAFTRWTGYTTLLALDCEDEGAAAALVAECPSPIHAGPVMADSPTQRVLESCGFHGTKRFTSIVLDLQHSWRRA